MTTTFTTHFRFGLPDFLSSPWQADWYTLVQLMDQVLYETALGTIIDVWANSTAYVVGNLRIDPNLGTIWTCLVAHTSAASPTTFATDRTNHSTFWGAFTVVDGDKGYITVSGSNSVYTINDGVVSNAKLSNMGQATFKMRAAGTGTGVPIDGTVAQAKTALALTAADISGFGAGIATWLATPSSANLLAALTDETGTGAAVFGTAPTLSAPVLTSPTVTTKISPTIDDGAPLGDTTHNFSDLFLASGSVINWNVGDITLTHGVNTLSFAGAAGGFFFGNTIVPGTNDGSALGASGNAWSDLFLASGAVINFNAGDVSVTHSADTLSFAGASNGYFWDAAVKPGSNDLAPLGSATVSWSDLFLAAGGVLNWNNSEFAIIETSTLLKFETVQGNAFVFLSTFGYEAGAGGTVTQGAGSGKATAVTHSKFTGEITLNNAALAAATVVSFVLTNTFMNATDLMIVNHVSGGTIGSYTINFSCGGGSGTMYIRNNTAGSLSEAIVIRYALIRGQVS